MKRSALVFAATLVASVSANAAPVQWTIGSGGNGHYYDFVQIDSSWTNAAAASAASSHLGIQGHLLTITSAQEQAFVLTTFGNVRGWIGASDAATEGTWRWVAGPEAGTIFYIKGAGAQPGYSAWDPADNEPNDTGGAEDVATFGWAAGGLWNDLPGNASDFGVVGYLVEFSGTPSQVPVPVPATLVLFGSALAALGVLRRRS